MKKMHQSKNKPQFEAPKYTYRVEWSREDDVFLARCLELPSISAHGTTPEIALEEIIKAVRESLRWMTEEREEIPEPLGLKKFQGNLTLRTSPEKHRELAIKSAEQGLSINQYIQLKLN